MVKTIGQVMYDAFKPRVAKDFPFDTLEFEEQQQYERAAKQVRNAINRAWRKRRASSR